MNTLIIGGSGFIGSNLASQLLASGRNVTSISRHRVSDLNKVEGVDYLYGDFGELDFICEQLDKHDEVVHLAYASVPNTSFDNPLADLQQNLLPSVQLFAEAAKRNTKLVLVSSGGTVYGNTETLLINENHAKQPISPYGLTKLTLENYAFLYGVTHNLEYKIVRPSNAYGIGQLPFRGQGFIATAVAAAKLKQPLKVFGLTGTVRDYIHVNDLAAGIVSVLLNGQSREIYNIGSGIGLNNLQVIEQLNIALKKHNTKLQIEHLPERPFDVKRNVLDSTKLKRETHWQPQIMFTDGLEQLVNHAFSMAS